MPTTARRPYCQAEGCVEFVSFGVYCDKHHALRQQHQTSHRMDGHSDNGPVPMCPKCLPLKV